MQDNALIALLCDKIDAALLVAGWSYLVVAKVQPTQQGTPSKPTVFYQKMFDTPYGGQIAKQAYRIANDDFAAKEIQLTVTTFQISVLAHQNPEDLSLPTASDIANHIKIYLESRGNIRAMSSVGAHLMRVSDIRNPPETLDEDRFEMHPSFDVRIQHQREVVTAVPAVHTAIGKLSPIVDDDTQGVFRVPAEAGQKFPGEQNGS